MAKTSEGAERDERVTQGGLSNARDLQEVWRHEQRREQGTDSGRISSGLSAALTWSRASCWYPAEGSAEV